MKIQKKEPSRSGPVGGITGLLYVDIRERGRLIRLGGGCRFTVGRGLDNSLVLNDSEISKHHICLFMENGLWWFEDAQSRNGTYLDGVRTRGPHRLVNGDCVRIGRYHAIWFVEEEHVENE